MPPPPAPLHGAASHHPMPATTRPPCLQGLYCAVHPVRVLATAALLMAVCCVGLLELRWAWAAWWCPLHTQCVEGGVPAALAP